MTENLPAVAQPSTDVERAPATADTDSWIQVVAEVAKFAGYIAETEFVPKQLRNKPAATAAAILYGREVGLPPMTSLTQTHVIEGRPGMAAEAMRALVLAAGHELAWDETTGARCVLRGRRRGTETWTPVTWTIDMARAAGLLGKDNWKNYPRRMLQARATSELCELIFPDVIHGFRATEELEDTEADGSAGFGPQTSTVQRTGGKKRATKKAAALPASKPAERPAPTGPPLPGEQGFETLAGGHPPAAGEPEDAGEVDKAPDAADDVPPSGGPEDPESRGEAAGESTSPAADEDSGEDEPSTPDSSDESPSPEPSSKSGRAVNRAQQRMLFAQFKELGLDGDQDANREERLLITSKIVGRPVASSNDLTHDEAKTLTDTLARCNSLSDVHAVLDAIDDAAEKSEGGEQS